MHFSDICHFVSLGSWGKLYTQVVYSIKMYDSMFERFPLFQELLPEQNSLIRPLFSACFETAGNLLFEQGQVAELLYLIVEGEVIIRYKPEDGPELLVAHIREGGVAGWSAALGNPIYTSSAVCTTDCQLLCIRGQDLRNLCERNPEIGSLLLERLANIVAERLRTSHAHITTLLEQGFQINNHKSLTTDELVEY